MKKKRYTISILFYLAWFGLHSFGQAGTLDYFINQGLAHSPVLKDINNQVISNTVDSLLYRAGQRPQVSYNGNLYYAPVINGVGYSEAITNLSNISSLVNVTQRIFNQKTIENQYSKFGIQNQALRISSKITENDLRKAITRSYLSAFSVSNDIRFNDELLTASKEEEPILKQLVERGIYKQVDYFSFMVEFKAQQLLIKDLQMQYRKEVASLHILCGMPDTAIEQIELPQIKLISSVNVSGSPLFYRFAMDSLKIRNERLGIDRNYKPSVNWFADAGLLSNMPRDIDRNLGFSVGLSLTVPIYDGHQRKMNYEKLKIAEDTRMNYAVFFKKQFSQQLRQLYSELEQTREIIPGIEEQLEFAEAVINQDKYLLNNGSISITEYIAALRNIIAIRKNINQYRIRILEIITEINYWNQ